MKRKYNLKKFIVIMLSLVMVVTMFAACGKKEEPAEKEHYISGSLPALSISEEDMNQHLRELGMDYVETKYFDDMNSMILALQGEKIDCIGRVPEATANYVANTYPDIKAVYFFDENEEAYLKYYMGFNSDKRAVADKVQAALDKMKSDGTMDRLIADYIDAFVSGGEPPAAVMPVFNGAETIKVVVTGDLPPFDYVSADGKPCGFNTAMLAELSNRINMNIELICTDSKGRAAALASGKADAVFYVAEYVSADTTYTDDCPEGIMQVGPFYESKCYSLIRAK